MNVPMTKTSSCDSSNIRSGNELVGSARSFRHSGLEESEDAHDYYLTAHCNIHFIFWAPEWALLQLRYSFLQRGTKITPRYDKFCLYQLVYDMNYQPVFYSESYDS